MRTKFKSLNTIALFNDLDQSDESFTRNMCTIYSCAIALKYNC